MLNPDPISDGMVCLVANLRNVVEDIFIIVHYATSVIEPESEPRHFSSAGTGADAENYVIIFKQIQTVSFTIAGAGAAYRR
jgi:hypothetical protein